MSIFDEFDEIIKKLRSRGGRGVSSGYSISVTYRPDGKPIVSVETYGDVDKEKLRQEIERQYPGAEIRGLEQEPLIWEEDAIKNEKEKSRKKEKRDRLGPNEIREVDE
jgi:hypothetical protein